MAANGTPSREAALKRSRRILKRALRTFRALPSIAARAAIEHALDAVQRADQLAGGSADPGQRRRPALGRMQRSPRTSGRTGSPSKEDPSDAGQAPGVGPPHPR